MKGFMSFATRRSSAHLTRAARLAGATCAALCAAVATPSASQNATVYNYDARGRLVSVGDATAHRSDYTLDKAGNRTNVTVAEQLPTSFAAISLSHATGHADGYAWAAGTTEAVGYMLYGPYTYSVSQGAHVAAYRMKVDNNSADNGNIAIIDVADGSNGATIASRTIARSEWRTAGSFEIFELPFTLTSAHAGHPIEFRVYYLKRAYLTVDTVGYR